MTSPGPPAVPPTPPVPLAALLARKDLGLRQIAGPVGAGPVLHGAHSSEMADPYPYLLGGDLLLTAGVHLPGTAGPGTATQGTAGPGTHVDEYVSRVVAAGGAALGFGVAPVHDTVPPALVAACEAHGLPLLEVPPQTTFAAVARAVWQLIERARTAELRRVTEAQQSLAAAASRPDPVPSVLRQLARRVGGRAVLYGPQGAEIAGAGSPSEADDPLAALARLLLSRAATPAAQAAAPSSAAPPATAGDTTPAGVHLSAYALGAGRGFVLGVAAPRRGPGDHTIASVAAVLLSLLTGEQQSGSGASRSSALVRLLLGGAPEEVAPLLGGERWLVVHGRPQGGRTPDPVAASALGAGLGSPLVDLGEDVVRVLVPAGRPPRPQPGWVLGVSADTAPAGWPAADAQAARALGRALAARTALVRHGSGAGLLDLVPADEARDHARAQLAPLAGRAALVETLHAWLSLHGSWDRTAVALAVHRNTVRQRIARCAALLDADLDDPDVRMELWFALKQD
ncbi:helix-turn-helix domain-containing protein [Streptomyces sp. ID05-04B]|uniref:helix-turn-helix domain-containing protein n=1 Tax=Streptomyces sp. ID05-04B TaxID=3028661 RepID=UPI0029C571E1|nr:helix-turn-helix domain-containing protein [Streptomyces sp. ID05-04B]MDX5567999.1 helix-turn-helix domain-containing protein [Streptomyces sp. ID05-04B]